jgi:NitT/TauT family transport system ATP-binding protein
VITLSGVGKRYGDLVVLRDLSLSLAPGSVTAVLGANGSGKTTLGRLLLGLEAPTSGTVSGLDGLRGAAVFQDNRLCEQLTAVGNVRLALPRAVPRTAAADELRAVGLSDESVRKPVRSLSGGQRRRVAIVRGVMADSDLVVLDEPFTGLDTDAKAATLSWVRSRLEGRTTLLITHDPAEATFFDATVVRLPGPAEGA